MMNKTINELWWKARIGYNNQSCDNEVIEKFAHLIIQECAEFARQHNLEHAERSHMIHKAIKEHFGVTE